MVLLTLLAATLIGVAFSRNMFGVVVMAAIYSFLIASVMLVLDAVDVAMTEAAVGAGISTVLLLAALHLTKSREIKPSKNSVIALIAAIVTAGALVFGTVDLPPFGDETTPPQALGPDYIEATEHDIHIPNVVTAVLASYRGFDTLGEVAVIFTAGIAVLILLRRRRSTPDEDKRDA